MFVIRLAESRTDPKRRRDGPTGQRFTTDDVAPRERLDYWRDAICDVFVQLDCKSASRRGFYGHVTSDALEGVRLSVVDADAQHVLRGRRQLAKASEDDFLLSLQLDGIGLVRQDGRDAPLVPGAMALYASTRPYELIFPRRFRQLVLQLPRAQLATLIGNSDALTASTLEPALPETRMLATVLMELQRNAGSLAPVSRAHVASSLVQSACCCAIDASARDSRTGARGANVLASADLRVYRRASGRAWPRTDHDRGCAWLFAPTSLSSFRRRQRVARTLHLAAPFGARTSRSRRPGLHWRPDRRSVRAPRLRLTRTFQPLVPGALRNDRRDIPRGVRACALA